MMGVSGRETFLWIGIQHCLAEQHMLLLVARISAFTMHRLIFQASQPNYENKQQPALLLPPLLSKSLHGTSIAIPDHALNQTVLPLLTLSLFPLAAPASFQPPQPPCAQHIDGINLFGLISISSLLFCVPAAIWAEGHMWGAAWDAAVQKLGPMAFYQLLAMSGLFYHLYNQVRGLGL